MEYNQLSGVRREKRGIRERKKERMRGRLEIGEREKTCRTEEEEGKGASGQEREEHFAGWIRGMTAPSW